MLEPMALPTAKADEPSMAAAKATRISGAEVPMDTTVRPMRILDTPRCRAVAAAPDTNRSALHTSATKPKINARTGRPMWASFSDLPAPSIATWPCCVKPNRPRGLAAASLPRDQRLAERASGRGGRPPPQPPVERFQPLLRRRHRCNGLGDGSIFVPLLPKEIVPENADRGPEREAPDVESGSRDRAWIRR